jgi:hypothetical protein
MRQRRTDSAEHGDAAANGLHRRAAIRFYAALRFSTSGGVNRFCRF